MFNSMTDSPVGINVHALISAISSGSTCTNWAINLDIMFLLSFFMDMIPSIDVLNETSVSSVNSLAAIWKWASVIGFEKGFLNLSKCIENIVVYSIFKLSFIFGDKTFVCHWWSLYFLATSWSLLMSNLICWNLLLSILMLTRRLTSYMISRRSQTLGKILNWILCWS